jgi:hypothetical protein
MEITAASHPRLFRAFQFVADERTAESYKVPAPWSNDVDRAETALKQIDEEDIEDFAIGDVSVQQAIIDVIPDIELADILLDRFMSGWRV